MARGHGFLVEAVDRLHVPAGGGEALELVVGVASDVGPSIEMLLLSNSTISLPSPR